MRAHEFITETTTAGGMATVVQGMGSTLTRNASIYGKPRKKTESKKPGKYSNSITTESIVNEGPTAKVDGQTVTIGDYVCYKADMETCGKITKIARGQFGVQLSVEDDDDMGNVNYDTVMAKDCWIEG